MRIQNLLATAIVICGFATANPWRCIDLNSKILEDGVTWLTQNCTMKPEPAIPDLTVNIVTVDLSSPNVRVVPGIADPTKHLQTLPDMATLNHNFIAGVNGGYFWRVDHGDDWIDDVCLFKTKTEALSPPSKNNVNNGVGDGLITIDGVTYSYNCNCHGFSRPAVMSFQGPDTNIKVLQRGETVGDDV
jgi:hypothetical protein